MWNDADWVNTGLAGFGVLVAIGGLIAVFVQIHKLRNSTEAARDATSQAMQAMAQHVTGADIEVVRRALRTILDNLHEEDRQSLWGDCQDARERLMEMRARPGLEKQQEQMTTAITSVAEAQKALQDGAEAIDWGDVRNNVSSALDSVVEVQQHALFFQEEGTGREQNS